MRTGKGLADLDEMASRVSQIPGVTKVSGVTRPPTGERLDQAELAWQNGQIGDKKMAGAVAEGNSRKDDLTKLTDGADQLADGLAQLDSTVRTAFTPLAGILTQAQSAGTQVNQFRPLLQQLSATAPPAVDQAIQSGPGLRPLANQAQKRNHSTRPTRRRPQHLTLVRHHPHNAPKSATRSRSWSLCATTDSSTKSPTSGGTATIPPPMPPLVAPSPTSRTQSPHWTRHSEPWVTPPT